MPANQEYLEDYAIAAWRCNKCRALFKFGGNYRSHLKGSCTNKDPNNFTPLYERKQ